MEFPGLGEHCSLVSCKRLDFLPMNCDGCNKTFCNEHYQYESHVCQGAYRKIDVQVPVCPLCNKPIPIKRGEPPDIKVGEHIDQDCESDPAKEQRKFNLNRCSAKGCKKKELVPVRCETCRKNYCLRHRHEQDHDCSRVKTQPNRPQPSTTKAKPPTNKPQNKPQQSSLSALGRDLDRARRERNPSSNSGAQPRQNSNQQALNEDEALALAIEASLLESTPSSNTTSPSNKPLSQEEEDRALAQAIADSEKETRQNQRQQQTNTTQKNDEKSCTIS